MTAKGHCVEVGLGKNDEAGRFGQQPADDGGSAAVAATDEEHHLGTRVGCTHQPCDETGSGRPGAVGFSVRRGIDSRPKTSHQ